jgi:hypothetical protein
MLGELMNRGLNSWAHQHSKKLPAAQLLSALRARSERKREWKEESRAF